VVVPDDRNHLRCFTCALVAVALAVLALPSSASAKKSQFTIFQATREVRSPNAYVRAKALDEIRALGVHWLRVVLYWEDVAPRPGSRHRPHFDERDPGDYPASRWSRYANIVKDARARGFRLLVTISGPGPRWGTRSRRNRVTRPSPARFRRFVTAVGRRYGDDVSYWSVWNEPNHPDFLRPSTSTTGRTRRSSTGSSSAPPARACGPRATSATRC
jgi:beta-glucosidase/6-phospho-beta-glucosidase/beta-galactosidase